MRPSRPLVLPSVREAIATSTALIDRATASLTREDTGFFGPGSISWRIHRHPAYSVSAIAALLLEALHPTAMAAIDQHSIYRRDAWRRAHRTAEYVLTITFSAREVASAAAVRVRAIHRRVAGSDPRTGRSYRADDEDLLLWIHCAGTETALRGHELLAETLAPAEADRYVDEQRRAGSLVGLEPLRLPRTRAELHAVLASYTLALSEPAAEFASLLFESRMPLTMRPFWLLHVRGALTALPNEARALYGFTRRDGFRRAGIAAARLALRAIDLGYNAFGPVRRARRRLRLVSET